MQSLHRVGVNSIAVINIVCVDLEYIERLTDIESSLDFKGDISIAVNEQIKTLTFERPTSNLILWLSIFPQRKAQSENREISPTEDF